MNESMIGKTFIFHGYETNPFEQYIATVLDIKNGWVKYKMLSATESTLPIKDFKRLYPTEKEIAQ